MAWYFFCHLQIVPNSYAATRIRTHVSTVELHQTGAFLTFNRLSYMAAAKATLLSLVCFLFLGDGKFSMSLNDFCISGISLTSLETNDKEKVLKIWELDAAVKTGSVKSNFENLVSFDLLEDFFYQICAYYARLI